MTDRTSIGMRCYTASRRELEDNGYPLNERGFLKLTGTSENPQVFAIDCEMHTGRKHDGTNVQEVYKISVVDHKGRVVYDKSVRPRYQPFGQSTAAGTVSLTDVHNFFKSNFNSSTIIVGHSLESDFRALNIEHENVVDVSIVYPRKANGEKYSLKDLVKIYLGKDVQTRSSHDSAEDAKAALDLMIHHIHNVRIPK